MDALCWPHRAATRPLHHRFNQSKNITALSTLLSAVCCVFLSFSFSPLCFSERFAWETSCQLLCKNFFQLVPVPEVCVWVCVRETEPLIFTAQFRPQWTSEEALRPSDPSENMTWEERKSWWGEKMYHKKRLFKLFQSCQTWKPRNKVFTTWGTVDLRSQMTSLKVKNNYFMSLFGNKYLYNSVIVISL